MLDAEEVRLAQAGDAEAAGRLLKSHLPGILRMLSRLLPTLADAEDVAQEACLHALVGLPGLKRPELFGPWFRTVAYNRAMQWQRRRYAEAALWPRLWSPASDSVGDVDDQVDLQAALGLLAPADREALVLRYVQGLTSPEIARLQGTVAGTVRWRLHRAAEQLRMKLEKE
ncbi:MAG TPA: RNA polymerase sigma factor [Symbiobacteriaceae bacterium]|nr:RNA polymerase sigma factor [Symbiobacteriaceae bacterium]